MLDVKNPEIDVDQIMQRIQEKLRLRRSAGSLAPTQPPAFPVGEARGEWSLTRELLERARETASMGAAVPPMSRLSGYKRAFATAMAKVFLRIAQLITRDQRAFNQAVLDVFHHFDGRLSKLHSELGTPAAQLTALRAELTSLHEQIAALRELAAASSREIAELRTVLERR